MLSPAFGLSHLLAQEELCLYRCLITLILLALVRISLCQVNLETGVNNLVESFADGDIGLVCLLDCHDSFNFPLTFFDSPLHVFVVVAHLCDESLVLVFLADNGRVTAFLNVVFDFESTLLIELLEFEAKAVFFPAKQFFQLPQVRRRLNFLKDSSFNFGNLSIHAFEEFVHSGFEGLGNDLRRNLVHVLERGLIGSKLLIKQIFQTAGYV